MRWLKSGGVALALLLVVGGCAPAEVEGPHGIRGFQDQGYFYVVPVEGGVVVVDSGGDRDAKLLKEAVGEQTIKAILLTHGHWDHSAGAGQFPDVKVLAHRDEVNLIQGVSRPLGFLPIIFSSTDSPPPAPPLLEGVEDGHVFSVGRDAFTAIHMPGHTHGALVWKFRDVLFGGDSVQASGPRLMAGGPLFDDDTPEAQRSLERLKDVDFNILLDGHNGRTDDAKSRL
ncbi:MAG: MBL fold metallo-hydrolase [Myxococcota bacterium]